MRLWDEVFDDLSPDVWGGMAWDRWNRSVRILCGLWLDATVFQRGFHTRELRGQMSVRYRLCRPHEVCSWRLRNGLLLPDSGAGLRVRTISQGERLRRLM